MSDEMVLICLIIVFYTCFAGMWWVIHQYQIMLREEIKHSKNVENLLDEVLIFAKYLLANHPSEEESDTLEKILGKMSEEEVLEHFRKILKQ